MIIGDPGPESFFDGAVYDRGAMTLHQLRLAVGDETFFRILQRWNQRYEGGNVTTAQFIALAEREFGQDLDALFDAWVFTPGRPEVEPLDAVAPRTSVAPAEVARSTVPNVRDGVTADLPR